MKTCLLDLMGLCKTGLCAVSGYLIFLSRKNTDKKKIKANNPTTKSEF